MDDNPSKRLAITAALEPLGHTVVEADSGVAALRAVIEQPFAVILMDVKMPAMSGYETAALIRQRRKSEHTPIIFITANARDEAAIPAAYESGAVDFIFAPVVPDILRAKVSIFVDLYLNSLALEQSMSQFRDSEARTSAVLDNVADGIVTLGDKGVIESFNRAASELFGYAEQEAIGAQFETMLVLPDSPHTPTAVEVAERQHQRVGRSSASVGRRKDTSTFPMELDLSEVQLGTRKVQIGCVRDISERQTLMDTLRHQALHDALTGLPNRLLFGDRVDQSIRAAARSGEQLALLVLDLDDFKQVNDTLGHQQGDELLKLVAARLVACLRDADTVARLGGDEFGILPLAGIDLTGAATIAWKIQAALAPSFLVDGHSLDVRPSIGIALYPEHGGTIGDLLRRADLAMYDAKRSHSGCAIFAAEQEETPVKRLALLGKLRRCIEHDELTLHFQPKVDLATAQTVGVEALLRWNHPTEGLLAPGAFMPEVEHSDLMIPITEWVIRAALGELRRLRDDGYDLRMSVNLGARCLDPGAGLFKMTDELMASLGIPTDRLTFELTESALIDTGVPDLFARLEHLDERLSIDDFGTGYSSLVYLQRLPVVEIKVDRSFVTTLCSVREDAVIVRSIIDLAHNLSLIVVAEGVEDEETMRLLDAYGCDEAQGYYFSRPLPSEGLVPWLESSPYGALRKPSGLLTDLAVATQPDREGQPVHVQTQRASSSKNVIKRRATSVVQQMSSRSRGASTTSSEAPDA